MGCNDSRKLYPEEERVLLRAETLLKFQYKTVQSLYETFTALSRSGILNSNALKDAITSLNLPIANEDFPGLLERFYHGLKDSNQNVSVQTMQLLAIFLGAGRPVDRAKILFQAYDLEYSLVLSKARVEQMMRDMMRVAVDVLGQLGAIGEAEHMKDYLNGLRSVQDETIVARVAMILDGKTEITREQFELRISQTHHSQLLTASGVRLVLFEMKREKLTKARPRVPAGLSLVPPKTGSPQ